MEPESFQNKLEEFAIDEVATGDHPPISILSMMVLFNIYHFGQAHPDSKVHGANLGPTCGRQDPGGPHVGHMNLAIRVG